MENKELTQFTRAELEEAVKTGHLGDKGITDPRLLAMAYFIQKHSAKALDHNVKTIRVYQGAGNDAYRFEIAHFLPPRVVELRDLKNRETALKAEIADGEKAYSERKKEIDAHVRALHQELNDHAKINLERRKELGEVQAKIHGIEKANRPRTPHAGKFDPK